MMAEILNRDQLKSGSGSFEFVGAEYGDVNLCFILVDGAPGSGPRLHRHPYAEVFVLLEGRATFTVEGSTLEAEAGQVVVVQPNESHKFVNSGDGMLKQIDIHATDRFITWWLEDEAGQVLPEPVLRTSR